MVNREMATLMNQALFCTDVPIDMPDKWYVGILKVKIATSDINGTISGHEITNPGYARVELPNTSDYFSVVSSSAELSYVTNKQDITFPDITGGGNATVYGFFLSKQKTGGTAYVWGNLTNSRTLYQNSRVVVRAGALHFALSNTEGGSTVTTGLIVDDQGILSGSMEVSTAGILS